MARWQHVNGLYQIYPRSFKDANGDGIGDLPGIIEKLDYIKGQPWSLGIDAIWISPFYTSPMADFGYDVSDYTSVDSIFGTIEDFKRLLAEAHARDIKIMIDYVPNHTSTQHDWFKESRASKDNDKRDWYIWHDPKPDGSPPNNWLSVFGGSAWEFDQTTGQYYLHTFLKEQPDLNWDNHKVRKAMTGVLNFWLSLGVDGIRADAVRHLSKDTVLFEDNPPNPNYKEGEDPYHQQLQLRTRYGDLLDTYLHQIAETIAKYPDRIILFEDYLDDRMNREAQYVNFYSIYPKVAAPFNFEGIDTPYKASAYREFIDDFQSLLGSDLRPFYCFGNHDVPRLVTRVGIPQARLMAFLQLTLPGIPVVYYGDELGMHNTLLPDDARRDPFGMRSLPRLGRDPERTPMQWNTEEYAGFSRVPSWLPLASDSATGNVEVEEQDPDSFLNLYRSLLRLRRDKALHTGDYEQWPASNDSIFGFVRRKGKEEFIVVLNMSSETLTCQQEIEGSVLCSTHTSVEWDEDRVVMAPHQGIIFRQLLP